MSSHAEYIFQERFYPQTPTFLSFGPFASWSRHRPLRSGCFYIPEDLSLPSSLPPPPACVGRLSRMNGRSSSRWSWTESHQETEARLVVPVSLIFRSHLHLQSQCKSFGAPHGLEHIVQTILGNNRGENGRGRWVRPDLLSVQCYTGRGFWE